MKSLTKEEEGRVFALALLAIVRKAKASAESLNEDQILAGIPGLKNEIINILLEHLDTEQLATLAAADLAKSIASILQKFMTISLMTTGTFKIDHLVKTTEKFCAIHLGREVKV